MISIFDKHLRFTASSRGSRGSVSYRLVLTILFLCIFLFGMASCSSEKSIFPTIPQNPGNNNPTAESTDITETTRDQARVAIRLAAPLSDETVMYLSQLYTAKRNNMLGVGITGQTVSIDFLDTIESDISVELLTTSSTGVNLSSYMTWSESGTIPDIILTDSMSDLIESGYLIPLEDYLAGNTLLSPANVYHDMVTQCYSMGQQYGIPFSASVSVIFVNNEILNAAGIVLPYEADMNAVLDASSVVYSLNEKQDEADTFIIPIYSGIDLMPYLPSVFDSKVGFMAERMGKIDLDSDGIMESIRFLREFDSSFFVESMTPEDRDAVFGTFDPITSKRVAMWIGQSDEVSRWANYMPYTLGITQIPSLKSGMLTRPALTVFPLCISSQSEYPYESADFAAFVALDPDAILLRQRLEKHEGFIPVVKSPEVWNYTFSDAKYCGSFYKYKDIMSEAYYCPFVSDVDFDEHSQLFLNRYANPIMDDTVDMDELLIQMKADQDE